MPVLFAIGSNLVENRSDPVASVYGACRVQSLPSQKGHPREQSSALMPGAVVCLSALCAFIRQSGKTGAWCKGAGRPHLALAFLPASRAALSGEKGRDGTA